MAAGVLLVWASATLVTELPYRQTAAPRYVTVHVAEERPTENRRAVDVSPSPAPPIQAPLERAARPLRARGTVQKPAAALEPLSVDIPAISVDEDLIELGVIGTTLQVPDDYADIGWWRDGPAPGEPGAAVMVGHVDSPTGPAVFYQLSSISVGDRVRVALDDGSRAVFAVRKVQRYEKSKFPSSQVYRSRGRPALHLLTCGGFFDSEAGEYSSNVVVYADLVKRIAPKGEKPGWYKRLVDDSRRKLADKQDGAVAGQRTQTRQPVGQPAWHKRLVRFSEQRLQKADEAGPR